MSTGDIEPQHRESNKHRWEFWLSGYFGAICYL